MSAEQSDVIQEIMQIVYGVVKMWIVNIVVSDCLRPPC